MFYTADFETTTDPLDCRVWACGICSIEDTSNFMYGNSIDWLFDWLENDSENHTLYFHNLKFDGVFIIDYLFKHQYEYCENKKEMTSRTFNTLISDKGQFYSLDIVFKKKGKHINKVTILDSLKILPFKVEEISKAFNLPMSKLSINYDDYREPNHILTPTEVDYLKNDVTIVAKALGTLFDEGLTKMTQGSNALYDYKNIVGKTWFKKMFPILEYDNDIRKSYKGGWTYLNPRFKNKVVDEGIVLDVNSLYPSVMYYDLLPIGYGIKFNGKYKHDELYPLYVQRFECSFKVKKNHVPMIQLKGNLAFIPTEYLTSSEKAPRGRVELSLTNVDLELFFEQYTVTDIKYISGYKFRGGHDLFKAYIDKWISIKIESTKNGNKAMRTLAKLMLNALYGKFGLNPKVGGKIPYLSNNKVKFTKTPIETRDPIYIPMATFITSYARKKTITSAQKVYDRFIYADTDSLHLIGTDIPDGLEIDPVKLGAWKHEGTFLKAKYLRQKSYMELLYESDDPKTAEWKVTCAGLPATLHKDVDIEHFHIGATFFGKLHPKNVVGGVVLEKIDFTIQA